MTIDFKIHTLEMALDNAGTEVGHSPYRVGLHRGLAVLHHHHAILVVSISNGKGIFGQAIKESFLGVTIVLKGLMIV